MLTEVPPRGRHRVTTRLLVTSSHQHPFTTNEVERIKLHFLIVNLIHILIDWFTLPFRHIRYTTRSQASTCLWVVVVQQDDR